MGILNRLFRRSGPPTSAPPNSAISRRRAPSASDLPAASASGAKTVAVTLYTGPITLEVVGESYRQKTLWALVGGIRAERVHEDVIALLVPEPENPIDENAISVLIGGQLVGYLSRDDAANYVGGLRRLIETNETRRVALRGVIVGGGDRGGRLGSLGVFLEHDPADFGIGPVPASRTNRHLRTGLSEAVATDLADESYDLSWLHTLGENDPLAIKKLRVLVADPPDPIDQHFMLLELEHRLYRCRDVFAEALTEFDAVCQQHHDAMGTIRPALVAKFGAVPVIELYRQSAIRWQKTKDWTKAREWAERGLAIYGEECIRPEAVADLQKRVAYATSKLEESRHPASRRTAAGRTVLAPADSTEVLECRSCGRPFE
jgi:hypothetical protein